MTDSTENHLVKSAQSGDRHAQTQLLNKYERLVHKFAWRFAFTATSHTHEDLAQEGYIGLLRAIRTYDPTKGAKFMTWAFYHIRGSITSCGRSDRRQPRYPFSLEDCPRAYNVEDPSQKIDVKIKIPTDYIHTVVSECCGGMHTKRARVVTDRFGLFGNDELRNCETAAKYGITKYAVNAHVYAFKKKASRVFPDLAMYV